jgi:hypothetical protein
VGKETQGKFKGARNSMKMRRFANKYRKMVRYLAPPAQTSVETQMKMRRSAKWYSKNGPFQCTEPTSGEEGK